MEERHINKIGLFFCVVMVIGAVSISGCVDSDKTQFAVTVVNSFSEKMLVGILAFHGSDKNSTFDTAYCTLEPNEMQTLQLNFKEQNVIDHVLVTAENYTYFINPHNSTIRQYNGVSSLTFTDGRPYDILVTIAASAESYTYSNTTGSIILHIDPVLDYLTPVQVTILQVPSSDTTTTYNFPMT